MPWPIRFRIVQSYPAGQWHMEDVHAAGGVPAILKEIQKMAKCCTWTASTVTGKTLGENIQDAEIRNDEVIRPLITPIRNMAAWPSSSANLAPNGAVVKTGGVSAGMMRFFWQGPYLTNPKKKP